MLRCERIVERRIVPNRIQKLISSAINLWYYSRKEQERRKAFGSTGNSWPALTMRSRFSHLHIPRR